MSLTIEKLLEGNKQFRERFFSPESTVFDELILRQQPKTMVIACSDSRVDPAIVFNCQPGELFVIRNVANLVPPCEADNSYHGISAALEFGTCFLQVEHIIVLGHTQCGGIRALLDGNEKNKEQKQHGFIAKWMELAQPAYDKVMDAQGNHLSIDEKITLCEQYALLNSVKNLQSFPWINQRIENNTLSLHAWYFDLTTGKVYQCNEDAVCF